MTSLQRQRKVFLSATVGADSTQIRRLLSEAGVTVATWEDLPARPTVADSIIAALSSSDAVVALLTSDRPPLPVVLEVGMALGAKVPVVLALSDKARAAPLPVELRELPIFIVPHDPTPAAASRLRSLLDIRRPGPTSEGRKDRAAETTYVEAVALRPWAGEAERTVAVALAGLGAQVVTLQPPNKRGRADLAIWVEGLPVELNPILVEVAGLRPRIRDKQQQLDRYIASSDSVLGILVLPNDHKPEWRIASGRAVVTLGTDNLQALSQRAFLDLLIAGRNRIAHAHD